MVGPISIFFLHLTSLLNQPSVATNATSVTLQAHVPFYEVDFSNWTDLTFNTEETTTLDATKTRFTAPWQGTFNISR